MKTKAELVDVRPDVVYQGTIYQYITVLSKGDTIFGVHDPDNYADEFEIGDTCLADLSLSAITNITMTDQELKGIRPNEETPEDYLDHTFLGEIVRIDSESPRHVVVDVGIGTADLRLGQLTSQETVDSLSVGEYVIFTVSNTRLNELDSV